MKKIILFLMFAMLVACEKEGEKDFSVVGKKFAYCPETVKVDGEYVYYVYLFINSTTVEDQVRIGSPTGRLMVDIKSHHYDLNYPSLTIDDEGVILSYTFITNDIFRRGDADYNIVR
jgi:hypothetical protein